MAGLHLNMKTITIDKKLCDELLESLSDEKHWKRRVIGDAVHDYSLVNLRAKSGIGHRIKRLLEKEIDCYFLQLRLNRWNPDDFIAEHSDTYLNYQGTVVMALDNTGDKRLKVSGEFVEEEIGKGFVFPKGTMHEVVTGAGIRYSLAGWYRRH